MIPSIIPILMSAPQKPPPRSCDTFVVVGEPCIFGKNSDRPNTERHEVVRFPAATHPAGSKLRCQYIEIPQAPKTHAVILSRPAWLWGAEMGANEHGVCCGNEAVFSREASLCDDGTERLLGMDIVRLVLERATTSVEAVEVAGKLMEEFGQGGGCSEDDPSWCYENSFIFADKNEAWVFETAGVHLWAAEKVPKGKSRNISNGISIRKCDKMHPDLLEHAKENKWWDGSGEFDWKKSLLGGTVVAADLEPDGREAAGKEWLEELTSEGKQFTWRDMSLILRDTDSGICMRGGFESTGSQISILPQAGTAVHSFTSNGDPSVGCYKPFSFADGGGVGSGGSTLEVWEAYKAASKSKIREIQKTLREREQALAAAAAQGSSPEAFDEAVKAELDLVKRA